MDPYIELTYSPDWGYLGKVSYFKQAKTQAVAVTTKLPVYINKKLVKELEERGSVVTSTHIPCILPPTAVLLHAAQTRCCDEESVNVFSAKKSSVHSAEKEVFGSCEAKELKSCYDRLCGRVDSLCSVREELAGRI